MMAFGKPIKLFNLFGFEVKLDLSWFFIFIIVTWSLATALFPHYLDNLSTKTYWLMGVLGSLGLFASILFHEASHSLMARVYGIPMQGITLFIFGGVAEMNDEPKSPTSECMIALAGPAFTACLSAFLFFLGWFLKSMNVSAVAFGVVFYLATINLVLLVFNLVPAFPLDGGRVLRAILWQFNGSIIWATRLAASIGTGISFLLITLGILYFFMGSFVGGLWWVLIGFFIKAAGKSAYQRLLIRDALHGEPVARFMQHDVKTVPSFISVQEFIDTYFYKFHYKSFPVEDAGEVVGYISMEDLKSLPREEWSKTTVKEISKDCEPITVPPETDAIEALRRMREIGTSRLLVMKQHHLDGIITLKDMLEFLSLKIELENS